MKKKSIIPYMLAMPAIVWAQADTTVAPPEEVVVVEEVVEASVAAVSAPEVVVITDEEIAGVSVNIPEPSIPSVTEALPEETEVVLEMPGSASAENELVMSAEEAISVDFPDEDVRTILRNVADLFDLNLVIPQELQGRASLKLNNVSWRQVYEVVLDPLNYTYVEDRNIIRIKSLEELTAEPVVTRVFVINYAKAVELQNSISPLIDSAAGGLTQVDSRSNALVVTERPSQMNRIQEIIEKLDRATEQVMIESKFVEVSRRDGTDIGVDWAFLDENPGDLLEGNAAGVGNALLPSTAEGNLLSNPTGSAIAVFSSSQFAATINALELNTDTRLVSNPTVVVMNNEQALFQVGEDFPIREYTVNRETGELESGELEYRFVGIELDVKPSVNGAGMISMDIKPTVSARLEDEVVVGPDGVEDQIFRKREAITQVTIKDGYTIALGGLTESAATDAVEKVPFLGDLPLLGKMFQSQANSEEVTNLIIFLTAKTLNPDGSTYREIIDPRQLDAVGHTESQSPGYEVSAAEMEQLRQAELARERYQIEDARAHVEADMHELEESRRTLAEKLKLVDEAPVEE